MTQLEQLTAIISQARRDMRNVFASSHEVDRAIAERVIEKGYSRQSEGEWIVEVTPLVKTKIVSCSQCGYDEMKGPAWDKSWGMHPFCPNCGAKMKGASDERN